MISNYFKIAWRNLLSNKILSVIKIGGLGLGLMVCMLILLYNKDELSFDHFHTNKKHIYRVVQTMRIGQDEPNMIGVTQAPLGPAFQKEIPGILLFARVDLRHVTVKKGNDVFTENPLVADTSFFSIFSFSLLKGNPASALKDPHSVILSEESAVKYFGTKDVLGKILQVKQNDVFENYTVTGLAENAPMNSSIQYKLILPFESFNTNHGWIGGGPNTFLLLSPQAKLADVKHKIQNIFDKNTSEQISKAKETQNLAIKIELDLQALTDIHLSSSWKADNGLENGSSPTYSYILSCIAFFILIIACINFVNLALAQSLKRGKEIGIRKVVGGTKQQLIWQFMVESLLVSFISFLLAIVFTSLLLPLFNKLADKKLSLSYLADSSLYISYLLLLLLTAFVAGFYPSLVLSRFKPVKVLYGREKFLGKNYFTRGLIVMQFALAIFLMIGSIAIYAQLNFFLHKDLGYKSNNLVKIDLPFSKDNDQLIAVFKNDLKGQPGILDIGARNRGSMITGAKADGKDVLIDYNKIDDAFFPTYGISFIAGRNFSPGFTADSSQSAIVNERFVEDAGWRMADAIGKTVLAGDENKKLTVVGVIRDYHFRPLKEKITAQLFSMAADQSYGQIWIRLQPGHIPETLSLLEHSFKKLSPFYPYDYQFMDDINARNYETETKWKQIIGIAAILFITISCMGLFGLVILSVEQRTKEIGIRKVLGAAAGRIVMLISKDFVQLIALAFLLAVPLGYWAIYTWLQHFAYRVDIKWWMFVAAGLLVMILALVTISFKAIKAAIANPAQSLRSE